MFMHKSPIKTKEYGPIGQRIKIALDLRKMTVADLAKKVGVCQTAIHKLMENPKTAGGRFIVEIAQALDVDVSWLKTGKGIDPLAVSPFVPLKNRINQMEKQINEMNLVLLKIDKIITKLWPDL